LISSGEAIHSRADNLNLPMDQFSAMLDKKVRKWGLSRDVF